MQHIPENTQKQLKAMLQDEEIQLVESLSDKGRIIADDGDWAAVPVQYNDSQDDDPDAEAAIIEDFENRSATLSTLEARLVEVRAALERMENGSYGISEISGKPIEVERLLANPAATTTIAEMQAQEQKTSPTHSE